MPAVALAVETCKEILVSDGERHRSWLVSSLSPVDFFNRMNEPDQGERFILTFIRGRKYVERQSSTSNPLWWTVGDTEPLRQRGKSMFNTATDSSCIDQAPKKQDQKKNKT